MLLFLFIAVSVIEIYLFIVIGAQIGALATIALAVITAMLGYRMLRRQSLDIFSEARQAARQGTTLPFAMIEGVLLLLGGAMLIAPGFFTDALGFFCLLRPSRLRIVSYFLQHFSTTGRGFAFRWRSGGRNSGSYRRYIEGEYRLEEDDRF